MTTYYDILQVRPDAEGRVIRESYVVLMGVYHPDRSNGDRNFTNFHAARINEAYAVLGDQRKRAVYDAALADGRRKWIGRTAHRAGHFVAARMARGANFAQSLRSIEGPLRARVAIAGVAGERARVSALWLLLVAPLLAIFLLIPRPDGEQQESSLSAAPGVSTAISAVPASSPAMAEARGSEPPRSRPAAPSADRVASHTAYSGQAAPADPLAGLPASDPRPSSEPRALEQPVALAATDESLPALAAVRPTPARAAPATEARTVSGRTDAAARRACFAILVNQGAPAYNACLAAD